MDEVVSLVAHGKKDNIKPKRNVNRVWSIPSSWRPEPEEEEDEEMERQGDGQQELFKCVEMTEVLYTCSGPDMTERNWLLSTDVNGCVYFQSLASGTETMMTNTVTMSSQKQNAICSLMVFVVKPLH